MHLIIFPIKQNDGFLLCCVFAGEGDIYAIALYHTKQSLASITTATDANIHDLEAAFTNSALPARPLPSVFLPTSFPLRVAPQVLSCPQIPPTPLQIVIPVSLRAKCRWFNKESLCRLSFPVFFFFFKYSYCHYLFPARFFTSPSSFILSLTSVLLLVAWLPATGATQMLGLCKWPRKSFPETARAPFVHLSILLLTGTLASTFSCAVFNGDVDLYENRKETSGSLNCRCAHTRKKLQTECVFFW